MKEIIVRLTSDRIKVKGGEYMQDLVRCKDCKWYNCEACFNDDGAQNHRDPDDFCSYGERREP